MQAEEEITQLEAGHIICDNNYGKCRCCLVVGKHQYNFGKAELEMLMENLNLFLMADPRLPHLLCMSCVTSLHDVQRFRQLVMTSEAELRQAIADDGKTENISQLCQTDPLELNYVKTEQEYEHAMSVSSVACDDYEGAAEYNTLKIEINPCRDTDNTIKSNVITELLSDSKKEESKTRLQTTKELCLLPVSKGLKLLPFGSEGLKLLPINNKQLQLLPITTKNIKLLPQSSETIFEESVTDVSTDVNNENESTSTKVKRKRNLKEGRKARKKKSESETDVILTETKPRTIDTNSALLGHDSRHLLLIDNSKVRSNIILILKNSTILPFRNNFKFAFKCFYCDKLYIPFKELKDHIEITHGDVTEAAITKIVRTMQNLIVTADISCIRCKICNDRCDSIDNLVQHLCDSHNKTYHETDRKPSHGILGVDLSTDTLRCHICNQDHTFFKNLLVHMNEHYGVFVCYVCGKKFLSERRYKSHVISTHGNSEIKCKQCSKIFKTEPAMKYHVKRVHLKTRVKCLYCPETFTSGNYVKRLNHMAEIHGITKPIFKCDVCGKELANSASLAHHKTYTHKRTRVSTCELCGYMTCDNSAMKKHLVVHSGVKNFECEFCKKRFAKSDTLKLHLKIHLNDKRFVCFLCDAAFIQKNSLKNHLQSRHPDSGVDVNKL